MAAGAFFCGHVGRALNATEASEAWWAVKVSNLRPSACKADALPTELTAQTPMTSSEMYPRV
jgi:hypothetical protein